MGEERHFLNSERDWEPVRGIQDRKYVIVLSIRTCIIHNNLHGFILWEFFTHRISLFCSFFSCHI